MRFLWKEDAFGDPAGGLKPFLKKGFKNPKNFYYGFAVYIFKKRLEKLNAKHIKTSFGKRG